METSIEEIGTKIFRISTALPPSMVPGGFSFNQYLIVDDEPLLFHTGSRSLFPLVKAAMEKIIPVKKLRYVGFSHYEQDECGAANLFLAAAPHAVPIASRINAMINGDGFDRPIRTLADGDSLKLGQRTIRWLDTPHVPHGWECGYIFEESTRTLFCGDLFTQPGDKTPALTSGDILGPSEAMRKQGSDYFSCGVDTELHLEKLAKLEATTLACMHGSAWSGDGAELIRALSKCLTKSV